MATDPDVIRLVELFLQSEFYRKVPVRSSGRVHPSAVRSVPTEMLCGPPDAKGFAEWRPVESPVDELIAAGFEHFLGVGLPRAFKSYLMYKCLIDVDLYYSILPELDPRHPLGWLEWSVKESRRSELRARPWYVPFTLARAGMGVLCFDSQRPDGDGDYPVMLAIDMSPDPLDDFGTHVDYVEMHPSFKYYISFICDSLEYFNGSYSKTQPIEIWLSDRGKTIPYEAKYYRSEMKSRFDRV
ncbi:MAG TPA: hypothetical protein VGZ22_02070 [Isosphaeraceae bacterium]|jgi:hypothetical protein|nr:hypothetical protein [Isosphaeraceae bacterium]